MKILAYVTILLSFVIISSSEIENENLRFMEDMDDERIESSLKRAKEFEQMKLERCKICEQSLVDLRKTNRKIVDDVRKKCQEDSQTRIDDLKYTCKSWCIR